MKNKTLTLIIIGALVILGFIYVTYFLKQSDITLQDIRGGTDSPGSSSSNVSFTIVNNGLEEKNLSYKWEIDDNRAGLPPGIPPLKGFMGSGFVTISPKNSTHISVESPPLNGEGTFAYVEVFEGNIIVASGTSAPGYYHDYNNRSQICI